MLDGTLQRSYGMVFDRVAASYDRHRPNYPEELIDHACEVAGIGPGDEVLEIGCGTGQLTRALLARGLRVTAIEPGDRLVALARQNLEGCGDVQFLHARLEDTSLPHERFSAVFSASAIHWVDPDASWRRAADVLVPDGTLALVQYFGVHDQHGADDQRALLRAISGIAPDIAADWPSYRDLETTLAGVYERRENISEVWSWLCGHDLARAYAAGLFDYAQIAAVPTPIEHTAEELNSLLGTMSFWARLSPAQRAALQDENRALYERLGRPIRASALACLVTARRVFPLPTGHDGFRGEAEEFSTDGDVGQGADGRGKVAE
jgi:SAM-dependent methyltransferase